MTRVKSINSKLTYNGYLYASDSKEHYKQGKLVKVLVDEDDFHTYQNYGWYISPKGYVYTMIDNHTILLHRLITNCNDINYVIDHHDGNKLNNTKSNLIVMTNTENLNKAWYEQNLYHTTKPVMMFDVDDYEYKNPLMKFDSIAEANEYFKDTGLSGGRGAISNACSGRAKTSYGYRWRYQN